jgi:small-conductance mechanosensitive channel
MSNEFWERLVVALAVIGAAAIAAKLVDRRISRRNLTPAAATRYRILRRSIFTTIIFVGILSALLVIPQVRSVATAILASSAVIGLVLGFAAQRTIGNFIAGLLIAFTQPVRLGDEIEMGAESGVVEEIGLTYTWVRTAENDQLVIPNEKLVSETLRNSTIRSPRTLAEVRVQVPLTADLRALLAALQRDATEAYLADLAANDATIAVRTWVPDRRLADRAASDLRLTIHDRMRELGIVGAA